MKKRILIIDDNPLNCGDYINPLEKQHNVDVCISLKDAERKILLYHYDFIVVDIMMPTKGINIKDDLKTGLFFYTEKLQSIENANNAYVLFWSNLSNAIFDDFFGEKIPANVSFVHKEPRRPRHLLEKITELIKSKNEREQQ